MLTPDQGTITEYQGRVWEAVYKHVSTGALCREWEVCNAPLREILVTTSTIVLERLVEPKIVMQGKL